MRKQLGYSLNVNFFVITAKAAKVSSTCEKPLSTCRENVILKVLFRVLFLYDFFPLQFKESRRHCGAKTLKLSSLSENQDWYLWVSRCYPLEVLWEGSNGSQLVLPWGTGPGPNVGAIFDSKKDKLHSTQACTFHFGVLCALLRVLRLRSYLFSKKFGINFLWLIWPHSVFFDSRGYILFCEFSLPIICIRSVYYHSSRQVRKQPFSRNHNQWGNRLCLHRWILNKRRKSSMERFGRRPVYPRGTLSMAAGRSGYITAFEYLWDNNLTQKISSYELLCRGLIQDYTVSAVKMYSKT